MDKQRVVRRPAISRRDGESWNYGNASLSSGRKRAEKKMDNEEQDIWEVGEEDNVGRMLRARREILPWERVVKDRALLQAPMDQPVCLECLGPLQTPVLCPSCKWPLCDNDCGKDGDDWHRIECGILTKSEIQPYGDGGELYSILGLLRLLLLKQQDEKSRIRLMMDHWEVFSRNQVLVKGTEKMANFLQTHLQLPWVTIEDVQHCFGVLKTNAMKIKEGRAQIIFPTASLLSHSCSPNLEVLTIL